ncbi:MAG: hypothetical protein ACLGHX_09650 [Acidimicrobiia bacterium]
MTTGWLVGYVVGVTVVVVVAALALTLIVQARKIGDQAGDILAALERSRDNTAPLWAVDTVNRALYRIRDAAVTARTVLVRSGR